VEVIKLFHIGENVKNIDGLVKDYDGVCDYYFFTGPAANQDDIYGTSFDWTLLQSARIEKPFLLGGGITAADASRLRAFTHPDFFGVDLASAFEVAPGEKDFKSLLQFRQLIK
jgi:phosphoribosylanthranilate isomerase